ncbi:hypothetical protein IGI03_21820 [Bacillus thuringiensis]|uniref:hypothetical protein n=1 Tax=Bacillus thuringiensis TaxID=1428 RepID=UPI00187508BC|nr:hypothetical protein [Bacillus thuringiensis]MBE5090660.1 hypothetical protein [Bacillus thuringiensis]
MKTKILQVYDEWTHMQFLLIQIEEVDLPKLIKREFSVGFKIIIDMTESKVAATSADKFYPDLYSESMEGRSRKISNDGTLDALSLLLNSVDDITHLPSEVNVKKIRGMRNNLNHRRIKNDLEDQGIYLEEGTYKKVFYKNSVGTDNLALVDDSLKLVYGKSAIRDVKEDYYWITCDELEEVHFKEFLRINDLPTYYYQVISE